MVTQQDSELLSRVFWRAGPDTSEKVGQRLVDLHFQIELLADALEMTIEALPGAPPALREQWEKALAQARYREPIPKA